MFLKVIAVAKLLPMRYVIVHNWSEEPTFVSTSKLVLFFAFWHLDPNVSLLHIYNANRKQ